ncbi:40S ribosomal protein S29 [Heterostelium album PN500]|uniref:40S ribosomal protein S29 n=1 Tax=Heterostelium pallidum (strain ATCC 26659 / Pp 5 / PN500) TaxID=670386 RepID=D3B2B2_HETP5|nr:40S ribosomal protein S29 [Heterostelium album PN500]EFA84487.1 40S ribosomal protein S29 [Heterostelium album PN500]|eukprot:XP_020436601.1 40S ribosomal protein S29 [Heterostelium album PN500]
MGPGSRVCRTCGNHHGIIRKYALMMCRRCFRANAEAIGFHKFYTFLCKRSKGLQYNSIQTKSI